MITITPDDTTTTLITHKRATLHLDLTDTTTPVTWRVEVTATDPATQLSTKHKSSPTK